MPFVCAGIRNTSVLSLLNVNRFRGRAVEQLKQVCTTTRDICAKLLALSCAVL